MLKSDLQEDTLELISEFTEALGNFDDTELLMDDILGILNKHYLDYAALKIVDPITEEIIIRFASGLSSEERKRGRYKIGEGITGKVVESGSPIIIRKIGEDSRFLNRTRTQIDPNSSFYCFPITVNSQTIGALSAMGSGMTEESHQNSLLLLRAITPVISQSLKFNEKFKREILNLQKENIHLRNELSEKKKIQAIVGTHGKMKSILEHVRMVADSNATVIIRGENGTGKELVADAIHYSSYRSKKAFIKINCAALPENLLESELFGHEKGSFTGAVQSKKGRFELAEGGTVFLDEIGEISQSIQIKLLRFLQAREFERVGGIKTIQSNVRIIAATNKDLEEEIKKGNFREDLYYRLNVFPLFVPPLRERKTDITLLADHFLEKYAKENGREIQRISTPAIDLLLSYHWPGNVRELENCMERAVLVCTSNTIRSQDLPPSLQMAEPTSPEIQTHWTLPKAVENLEREMIFESLKNHNGHQGKSAKELGLTERQMGYKMKKYGLDKDFIRSSIRPHHL